jgi:NTP pyrophosphatase (non-canonical NTP hydrolase)
MEINEFARINHERSRKYGVNATFNWEYFLIAMSGECGELLNKLKKVKRGDFELNKEEIAEEVADVITYAFLLLRELDVNVEKAILEKFEKVNKRIANGGFGAR